MRALIQPTLLVTARLGLFLSVVAWGVGQWRHTVIRCPIGSVGVVKRGVCVYPGLLSSLSYESREYPGKKFSYSSEQALLDSWTDEFFESLFDPPASSSVDGGGSFVGVTVFQHPKLKGAWLSFRHWLIVTIFAVFNVVLMWIYRKRSEVKPYEV